MTLSVSNLPARAADTPPCGGEVQETEVIKLKLVEIKENPPSMPHKIPFHTYLCAEHGTVHVAEKGVTGASAVEIYGGAVGLRIKECVSVDE